MARTKRTFQFSYWARVWRGTETEGSEEAASRSTPSGGLRTQEEHAESSRQNPGLGSGWRARNRMDCPGGQSPFTAYFRLESGCVWLGLAGSAHRQL